MENKAFRKFPAQPNHPNVSAITRRSGKELPPATSTLVAPPALSSISTPNKVSKDEKIQAKASPTPSNYKVSTSSSPLVDSIIAKALFPSRLAKLKVEDKDEEILEMFKKVQINIPLLIVVQQVPRYAKFIKVMDKDRVLVSKNISVFLRKACLKSAMI